MKIAIITGASSGMGRRFAETCDEFGELDEIWAIARRADRLESLKATAPYPVRPISLDLSTEEAYEKLQEMLAEETPDVRLLVNASGFGKFDATCKTDVNVNLNMVDLNCKGVLALSQICIPYMKEGARIVNLGSVAALQPIPYINVYAATKAFVLYFSRALNREVKDKGIRVMAVCPFWTKTEFFDRAVNTEEAPVVKKYIAMYDPKDIVERAWRDLKRGKDVSMYGFIARGQAALVKCLPHSLVMSIWMGQQDL
ncbi:MAG: SDR family NAD(P)-dependent oxidoreductase [Lachnospiraceae bacterium]|nr:SDR family NAD(P)-dependent oxidoreductase [Lachnospiraceae bacterium]